MHLRALRYAGALAAAGIAAAPALSLDVIDASIESSAGTQWFDPVSRQRILLVAPGDNLTIKVRTRKATWETAHSVEMDSANTAILADRKWVAHTSAGTRSHTLSARVGNTTQERRFGVTFRPAAGSGRSRTVNIIVSPRRSNIARPTSAPGIQGSVIKTGQPHLSLHASQDRMNVGQVLTSLPGLPSGATYYRCHARTSGGVVRSYAGVSGRGSCSVINAGYDVPRCTYVTFSYQGCNARGCGAESPTSGVYLVPYYDQSACSRLAPVSGSAASRVLRPSNRRSDR